MEDLNNPDVLVCSADTPRSAGKFARRWYTEVVIGLALGIAEDKAFERMPILADALEEAGCDDCVLLDHCRCCGSHVSCCWALRAALDFDPPSDATIAVLTPKQRRQIEERIRTGKTVTWSSLTRTDWALVLGLVSLFAIALAIAFLRPGAW